MIPVPKEDCTKEEAIEYLSKHIELLNEEIHKIRSDDEKQTRAWALDRAVRVYEKASVPPQFTAIEAMANDMYNYAMGGAA